MVPDVFVLFHCLYACDTTAFSVEARWLHSKPRGPRDTLCLPKLGDLAVLNRGRGSSCSDCDLAIEVPAYKTLSQRTIRAADFGRADCEGRIYDRAR